MNGFSVEFVRSARRELERLPGKVVQRIIRAADRLRSNPKPRLSRKLVGHDKTYRLRVGEYRVVYEVDDRACSILVTRVRHRKDAYR